MDMTALGLENSQELLQGAPLNLDIETIAAKGNMDDMIEVGTPQSQKMDALQDHLDISEEDDNGDFKIDAAY